MFIYSWSDPVHNIPLLIVSVYTLYKQIYVPISCYVGQSASYRLQVLHGKSRSAGGHGVGARPPRVPQAGGPAGLRLLKGSDKYVREPLYMNFGSSEYWAQDLRLYKVWVKFKEDEKDSEKRSMSIHREGDVDNEADVLISAPGPASVQQDTVGNEAGPGTKTKTKRKDPNKETGNQQKEKKEKTPAQQAKQARFG